MSFIHAPCRLNFCRYNNTSRQFLFFTALSLPRTFTLHQQTFIWQPLNTAPPLLDGLPLLPPHTHLPKLNPCYCHSVIGPTPPHPSHTTHASRRVMCRDSAAAPPLWPLDPSRTHAHITTCLSRIPHFTTALITTTRTQTFIARFTGHTCGAAVCGCWFRTFTTRYYILHRYTHLPTRGRPPPLPPTPPPAPTFPQPGTHASTRTCVRAVPLPVRSVWRQRGQNVTAHTVLIITSPPAYYRTDCGDAHARTRARSYARRFSLV